MAGNDYKYGYDISDENPLPVKNVSIDGDNSINAQRTFEKPLYIVDYDNLVIPAGGNEIQFNPDGRMFRFVNTSMTDSVFFGFTGGETNQSIPLYPRNGSAVMNDQGTVYLYANASSDVVVHVRRLEAR